MSNRRAIDTFPRCTNTRDNGVCMYIGPCLECYANRARGPYPPAAPTIAMELDVAETIAQYATSVDRVGGFATRRDRDAWMDERIDVLVACYIAARTSTRDALSIALYLPKVA